MAPRTSKGKTPAKSAAVAPAAASSSTVPINLDDLLDEFQELYANIRDVKSRLLSSVPGIERRSLLNRFSNEVVSYARAFCLG